MQGGAQLNHSGPGAGLQQDERKVMVGMIENTKWVCWLLALTLVAGGSRADEVTVAVASNFMGPMRELQALFEAASPHRLQLSFGSSGRFHAQVLNGAPFDLLLSADQEVPAALEAAGRTVPGSRFTYAEGRLVLWSPDPALVDAAGEVLQTDGYQRLALANPRLAPYGAAAVEVLQALGLEGATRPRWVMGENIAQAYQFVSTRNAQLGFVAWSQVIDRATGKVGSGSLWQVPATLHAPILQDAVLLKGAARAAGTGAAAGESAAAREFRDFLRSEEAAAVIRAWGYEIPQSRP